jgi:signal transduction histidine kinase
LEKTVYMDALINDLNLTLKLKNESFPMNKKKENLVELLRDTVISILNDARFEGRLIHFVSELEEVWLEFDPHLMKRAFTNLVMNALVHNGDDTEISVHIFRDDMVIFEISDNGKGITQEEQEKLFERYYRGTSTNDFYDGSGLGLAISREIIESHGGSIGLKSSVGKGTVVRVSL